MSLKLFFPALASLSDLVSTFFYCLIKVGPSGVVSEEVHIPNPYKTTLASEGLFP